MAVQRISIAAITPGLPPRKRGERPGFNDFEVFYTLAQNTTIYRRANR
jgi:hypothetical protein